MIDLREMATRLLETAKRILTETGSVSPFLGLVFEHEGEIKILSLPAPPHAFGSDSEKELLFNIQRIAAKKLGADATITITDTWLATVYPHKLEEFRALGLHEKMGTDALVAGGWGERREAILVLVQAPLAQFACAQRYYREGEGIRLGDFAEIEGPIGGKVQTYGQPEERAKV